MKHYDPESEYRLIPLEAYKAMVEAGTIVFNQGEGFAVIDDVQTESRLTGGVADKIPLFTTHIAWKDNQELLQAPSKE